MAATIAGNPYALGALVLDSVQVAARNADDYVTRLEGLVATHGAGGLDDVANAATKDARIGAFRVNKDAQARLTPLFDDGSIADKPLSLLKQADAHLEDSAWQIQNKTSPDGRFVGIDRGGALDDAREAVNRLRELIG